MSARQPHELLEAAHGAAGTIAQLVPVRPSIIGGETVHTSNARELHAFLESGQEFRHWIKDRISQYDFAENHDYATSEKIIRGGRAVDYHITLGMAKELAMVERTAKGKEARQYYIECERLATAAIASKPAELSRMDLIELAMAAERERLAADAKVQQLEHQVAEQAPAVEGFNLIADASGSLCFRDAAANLKMRQCDLMDYLVSKKWIYERVGSEGYKAYGDRLQALDLRYNSFPYESKTTGEPKTRRQVRITNRGLTKLAAMIAQDAVAKRLAAGAGQNQQRLALPEDDG